MWQDFLQKMFMKPWWLLLSLFGVMFAVAIWRKDLRRSKAGDPPGEAYDMLVAIAMIVGGVMLAADHS